MGAGAGHEAGHFSGQFPPAPPPAISTSLTKTMCMHVVWTHVVGNVSLNFPEEPNMSVLVLPPSFLGCQSSFVLIKKPHRFELLGKHIQYFEVARLSLLPWTHVQASET